VRRDEARSRLRALLASALLDEDPRAKVHTLPDGVELVGIDEARPGEVPELPPEWEGCTLEDWKVEYNACLADPDQERMRELTRISCALAGRAMPPSSVQDYPDGRSMVLVHDEAGLGVLVGMLAEEEGLIGLDVETTALDPKDGLIRLVQLARGNVSGVIDAFFVDPTPVIKWFAGLPDEVA